MNPYQALSVEIELRHLERTLLKIRQWIQTPPADALLTHYRPVPDPLKSRLEVSIEQMLAEIAFLADTFRLQPELEDLGRAINAEMANEWSDLHEALSLKLKRYGDVAPELAEQLDPHLRTLIRLAQDIAHSVGHAA